MDMIQNFADFCAALLDAGFSLGGGNPSGIYSVIPYDWSEAPPAGCPIRWHTGDAETDPWSWRMRVLDERSDIAYAKLFFKKSGYITREWYPLFLAARRGSRALTESYSDGLISRDAKRIYDALSEHGALPVEEIKRHAGFGRESVSAFGRALVELQGRMFITMCGSRQRVSNRGEPYGWQSTVFCPVEKFFDDEVFREAARMEKKDAYEAIRARVLALNPQAEERCIRKFIEG